MTISQDLLDITLGELRDVIIRHEREGRTGLDYLRSVTMHGMERVRRADKPHTHDMLNLAATLIQLCVVLAATRVCATHGPYDNDSGTCPACLAEAHRKRLQGDIEQAIERSKVTGSGGGGLN